ncbi:MAG: hypothetical protein AAF570_22710, partial [Bacteroidota bacterium]
MKTLIEKMIRLRNPNFRFSEEVRTGLLLQLSHRFAVDQLRAMRLLLSGKRPWLRFLGRRVRLVMGSRISLGKWVKIGDHCTL